MSGLIKLIEVRNGYNQSFSGNASLLEELRRLGCIIRSSDTNHEYLEGLHHYTKKILILNTNQRIYGLKVCENIGKVHDKTMRSFWCRTLHVKWITIVLCILCMTCTKCQRKYGKKLHFLTLLRWSCVLPSNNFQIIGSELSRPGSAARQVSTIKLFKWSVSNTSYNIRLWLWEQ